jgi:hypothetical protein
LLCTIAYPKQIAGLGKVILQIRPRPSRFESPQDSVYRVRGYRLGPLGICLLGSKMVWFLINFKTIMRRNVGFHAFWDDVGDFG